MTEQDLYSKLWRVAQSVIVQNNLCEIQKEADGRVTCLASRQKLMGDNTLCCGGCKHLTATGCSVEALSCKVWTCYPLQKLKPELAETLHTLRVVATRAALPLYIRASKEDTFDLKRVL